MYYFMSCFGFKTLDGSVKQAETVHFKEEEKMGVSRSYKGHQISEKFDSNEEV